ncbi:MAG: hypothetical protein EMLJLAPB_00125 [Candidatus Argoarchaeum ethanivorans]|uniref:Uncharacterized protein n=1 Tax=Candidatus Argoarchaeum ethanivorans TaxID=2608793 RepID=A0A811T6Q6_9EURY|nr:MAG: hypothetical protein EMLJLAPB_00125 [Candidatus Argoarchaeum ethanivorans]
MGSVVVVYWDPGFLPKKDSISSFSTLDIFVNSCGFGDTVFIAILICYVSKEC